MVEKKRIEWIDTLKGFSMYTIILCHLNLYKPLRDWFVTFNMPIYFLTSGATLNIEKIKGTSFGTYVFNLFKRLIVPYLWLQMFSFILRYAVNIVGAHKEVPVVEYLKGIIIGNNLIVNAPSNPLYYIYMLFAAQIGLWVVIQITKGHKGFMALILIPLSLISVFTQGEDFPWHINGVPNVMLSIFIGRILMDLYLAHKNKLNSMINGVYILVCAALFAVGYFIFVYNGTPSTHGNEFGKNYLLYLISGFATTIAFALAFMRLPTSKVFNFIGMNTLFYMGIHKPFLLVLEEIFEKYEDNMVFVFIASLVCLFALLPLTTIANKFFPYINGNPVREETALIKVGKYLAVAATWAVPYLYLNNHFMGGVLRESIASQAFSALIYIALVVVGTGLINRFAPFIFLSEKKTKKIAA